MATITIRNLPDDVRDALRVQAAAKGRSMEAEARAVIVNATASDRNTRSAAVDRDLQSAQNFFAQFRSDTSVVDELIAERRLEALRETLDTLDGGRPKPATTK